jgi:NAD(P)H dehydrogenase (quinone)
MNAKIILLINGHPNADSLSFSLTKAYKDGALSSGAEVHEINIRELDFNPNLKFGYQKRTELEPDLLEAQKKIKKADHIVWIYPVWWGSIPAIMKGFIDRTLLPGYAFEHRKDSVWWDKLLLGKSSRIICTMDQPNWYYKLVFRQPSHQMMKRAILEFCGIAPVRITAFGPVNVSKKSTREKWLDKVRELGFKNK